MNLLIFSPYYPPHRGGLETHSDEFNKHLSSQGVAITVFTPRLPLTALPQETLHTGVRVIRYPAIEIIHNYPIPIFWRQEFWRLWKELKKESFTTIISRTRFFFPSLMAGYYARRQQLPWVHIEHGSDFAQFESNIKDTLGKIYDYTLGTFILKRADILVANSHASKKFVEKLSNRKDCHIIYRGIEKELILNASPETSFRTTHQDKLIVGYIGRLIEGKGVKDLIQSFADAKISNSLLVIIGDGPESKALQEMVAQASLAKQVLFLGALPLPVAMGYLKVFDISVNPSYTEGIPTSVIEAALLEKAIIATNVGGTNEIISGNNDGILVPPRDVPALTQALITLAHNPELRHTSGVNAEQRVASTFVWESAIAEYQQVFKNL